MINVSVEKQITVSLELDEKAARWLKNYMQNSFCDPSEEEPRDTHFRLSFFHELNKVLTDGVVPSPPISAKE